MNKHERKYQSPYACGHVNHPSAATKGMRAVKRVKRMPPASSNQCGRSQSTFDLVSDIHFAMEETCGWDLFELLGNKLTTRQKSSLRHLDINWSQ